MGRTSARGVPAVPRRGRNCQTPLLAVPILQGDLEALHGGVECRRQRSHLAARNDECRHPAGEEPNQNDIEDVVGSTSVRVESAVARTQLQNLQPRVPPARLAHAGSTSCC